MVESLLPPDEHEKIALAIKQAETRTAGEIHCVLARSSDSYFYPAAFVVAVVMLCVSFLAAMVLHLWWIDMTAAAFVGAQIVALGAAVIVLAGLPELRPWLVPKRLRYRRAHDNALKQFLAHNIHLTEERTGVLIFVSQVERYGEIVADDGINSRVDQRVWDEAVAALIAHARDERLCEGFVEAIEMAGRVLAEHFPPSGKNPNEIDDHLSEI